jgi:excisionase family DNA binding protein
MSIEQLPPLLTVEQAAEYLQVPVSWIYDRTRKGDIPMRKVGRHCRFPRAEFLLWIERLNPKAKGAA